jgi:hypothetical protein
MSDEKVLYDSQGRRRSRATMPEFSRGRKPKNADRKWPAQVLTHRQILALVDTWNPKSAAGARNRAMTWLVYAYDLKSIEICALATWDYSEDERRLCIPAGTLRGRAERIIQLDAFTTGLMADWLTARDRVGIGISDPLFCTATGRNGASLDHKALIQALARARAKAGVRRRVTTQGLRLSGRQRRVSLDAIEQEGASRATRHLRAAWDKLKSGGDVSGAYREAVRSVEAAAKPFIEPNNPKATLGTMLRLLKDHPDRWQTTLGSSIDVQRMMAMLWTNQLDRHGTDDETVPLHVDAPQTDVAVHLAIVLCRIFSAGHVTSPPLLWPDAPAAKYQFGYQSGAISTP